MPKRKRDQAEPTRTDQEQLDNLNQKIADALGGSSGDESGRIKELILLKGNADGARYFIDEHKQEFRGKFRQRVDAVIDSLAQSSKKIESEIAKLQGVINKRGKFASTHIRRQGGEYAGDGNCYITFVNVGIGDCTIVASPLGRRIMIDCGSDGLSDVTSVDPDWDAATHPSAEGIIRNVILDARMLNSANEIDLLFLTHPDSDHHNQLRTILGDQINVGFVYFGGTLDISLYRATTHYLKDVVRDESGGSIAEVVVREQDTLNRGGIVVEKTVRGTPPQPGGIANTLGHEFIDPDTGALVIYYEERDGERDFTVSLLAANTEKVWNDRRTEMIADETTIKGAAEMKQISTPQNRGSLVVLIECHGERVLVCGDATAVTEKFVFRHFEDTLGKVDYLRMGHHGSPTSSTQFFLTALKSMRMAVASTSGATTVIHGLPKKRIIDLIAGHVAKGAPLHDIYSFELGSASAQTYLRNTNRMIWATGSNGDRSIVIGE